MKYWTIVAPLFALVAVAPSLAADLSGPLQRVKAIKKDGQGHAEAIVAMRVLEKADAADLPVLLTAMDDASPLALNWLRGAFETVASKPGAVLPQDALMKFFEDESHLPQARRLAYDTLKTLDPGLEERVIPTLLNDPSAELRRDAVAYTMQQAEKLVAAGQKDSARERYGAALAGAVDEDQVKKLAEVLKGFDQKVNLVEHYGFVTTWRVIGPFDNKDKKGFDVVNPPEKVIAFDQEYEGMADADGKPFQTKWVALTSEDEMGVFDINKLFAKHKGATAYLVSEFDAAAAQPVEFRFGTSNAWKLWVNGELLFSREEYHRGMFLDQYSVRGQLKPGKNTILMKVLQNEQEESWAQDWSIQFRVCDYSGRAVKPARPVAGQ